MADRVLQLLSDRSEFIGHLEEDINKNNQILEQTAKEKDTLEELIDNIKTLGTYPEHTCLIPLAKNIYMNGRIVHTGEHYLKLPATPDSFVVLHPLQQTLNSLEKKVEVKETEIEKAKYANYQLEERMRILKGDTGNETLPEAGNDDLPSEISSEKGVALKMGEFYEILEFED